MNFKTAVFTAEHGYKWTTPPEGITESQLSRYTSIIDQAYREGMGPSDNVQGVIYDGSLVAVFSALRTGPGWDTAGRAAKYYALAFITREQWPQVNFDVLLQNPFFLQPDKNPPSDIVYSGPVSEKVDDAVLSLFANGGIGPARMDFSCLGNFLSDHFQLGLNWRFYRSNIQNWHGQELVFEKGLRLDALFAQSSNTAAEKTSVVDSVERRANTMAAHTSIPDLPSSDVAKFSVKIKCMQQDIDAGHVQMQSMSKKLKLLTITVVALVAFNICLLALILFTPDKSSREGKNETENSLPKLEERLNKRKAKSGSIADATLSDAPAAGDSQNPAKSSAGNRPDKTMKKK